MTDKKSGAKLAAAGCAVGAVNGVFGGGGGMIAVPVLGGLLGYPQRCAHATAILIIAPVSLAGVIAYAFAGYLWLNIALPASVGMVTGGALGALGLNKLPLNAVRLIFIAVMLAAGIRMVLP